MTEAEIARMSNTDKVGEAMRRSLPHMPAGARGIVEGMIQPLSLAIIAGTLVVWAGSHFFGVGEVVDIILLAVGVVALGFSVFEGASELYDFADNSINARTDHDLEAAGHHFARAVVILGISTIQAVLLRGQGRAVVARGRPQIYPRMRLAPPPPGGSGLQVTRPPNLPGGILGETSPYGVIRVARNQSLTEQRLTLLHELGGRSILASEDGPVPADPRRAKDVSLCSLGSNAIPGGGDGGGLRPAPGARTRPSGAGPPLSPSRWLRHRLAARGRGDGDRDHRARGKPVPCDRLYGPDAGG